MTDAYEIGIQLLLQEDVSAGLEVINRGLAEVDRAIAATSADLAGLARQAESVTKAVANTVSDRVALSPARGQKPNEAAEPAVTEEDAVNRTVAPRSAGSEAPGPTPAVPSSDKAAAPDVKAAESLLPSTPITRQSDDAMPRQPPTPSEKVIPSSAPVKRGAVDLVNNSELLKKAQSGTETSRSVVSALVASAAPQSVEVGSRSLQNAQSPGMPPPRTENRPSTPAAVTASVRRAHQSASAARPPELARLSPGPDLASQRERPAAPWSGVAQSRRLEAARLPDTAATPQQAGRNESEAGGGTVMLDGRLVGQWLSEHMGREASRPPSGTSFFDARQTPAWNVSGAL